MSEQILQSFCRILAVTFAMAFTASSLAPFAHNKRQVEFAAFGFVEGNFPRKMLPSLLGQTNCRSFKRKDDCLHCKGEIITEGEMKIPQSSLLTTHRWPAFGEGVVNGSTLRLFQFFEQRSLLVERCLKPGEITKQLALKPSIFNHLSTANLIPTDFC